MAFDPCAVCVGCIPANIDERLFHQMALVALCNISAGVESGSAFTSETGALSRAVSSGVGSVATGAYSVKIRNVGAANGTVLGVVIEPDEEIRVNAFVNPVTKVLELVPAIAFDGTGTTLAITRFGT